MDRRPAMGATDPQVSAWSAPHVLHRDLKLENVLLAGLDPATADAKLADFGLCKLVKVGSGWGGVKVGWGQGGVGLSQGGVGSRWGGVKVRWGRVKVGFAAYLLVLSNLWASS